MNSHFGSAVGTPPLVERRCQLPQAPGAGLPQGKGERNVWPLNTILWLKYPMKRVPPEFKTKKIASSPPPQKKTTLSELQTLMERESDSHISGLKMEEKKEKTNPWQNELRRPKKNARDQQGALASLKCFTTSDFFFGDFRSRRQGRIDPPTKKYSHPDPVFGWQIPTPSAGILY